MGARLILPHQTTICIHGRVLQTSMEYWQNRIDYISFQGSTDLRIVCLGSILQKEKVGLRKHPLVVEEV